MSPETKSTLIWTIGLGGLIGSAINQQSEHSFGATPIRWNNNSDALTDLTHNLDKFRSQIASHDSWGIIWAAGSATTSTDQDHADRELDLFAQFLAHLAQHPLAGNGTFVLISSAGGVYAGAHNPPFTEDTPPRPIGVYGHLKLAQEKAAHTALESSSIRLVIARVSNAYGPGQDLHKLQGLISKLALSTLRREPINLFVPLSTVRDFIYTADLAAQVQGIIRGSTAGTDQENFSIRIVSSQSGTSIGQILRTCQEVFHRRIPTAMGSHPSSAAQASDLRFITLYSHENDHTAITPLPVGIKTVFDDVSRRLAQNSLSV